MDFSYDSIPQEHKFKHQANSSAPPMPSFYEIPNHFPLLTKCGISQWLPKQFKPALAKLFQSPFSFPQSPLAHASTANPEKFPRKVSSQRPNPFPIPAENPISINSKISINEKEKQANKAKMITLCDELEFTVRKIPSFQIKGITTPSWTKYEMMKTISPLKVTVERPEKNNKRGVTGYSRKTKSLQSDVVEAMQKDENKAREWVFFYFLDAIRVSNGLGLLLSDAKAFKFYVGPGNNSGLVVRTLRTRPWWVQTDKRKEANFIWTSFKHQKTLNRLQSGKNIKLHKGTTERINTKRHFDCAKYGLNFVLCSEQFCRLEHTQISSSSLRICNRLEDNESISSKKKMFSNMKAYYSMIGKSIFDFVPVTFHIKSLRNNEDFQVFCDYFNSNSKNGSVWIIKPGENTNRGKGIALASSIETIRELVAAKAGSHTCIIQKYIEKPLLINRRKFDIRCFALLTSINSNLQGYYYKEGYIRTSSKEFHINSLDNKFVHLTNDAVQKNSEDYGKFEPGNKMSYAELKNYIAQTWPRKKIDFERDLLGRIREIVIDSFKAVKGKIDPFRRLHSFELFGYDFMIDEEFNVWLIEVNTNPCLETSCSFLSRLIPACIDNTIRIAVDPLFPPQQDNRRTSAWLEDANIANKFELVFNEFLL